jgi:ribosomal-protein-alanine N-acetyltransferase
MPGAKAKTTTSSIHLRGFHAVDFETIYAIDQSCYTQEIAYSRRELRWYLRLPGAKATIAEDDGKVIAFILSAHWDMTGHIVTIDVLPEFRRRNVGTALIRAAEARLIRAGVAHIEIETATNNFAAIAFWKKHGYVPRGILQNYYPGGLSAHSMIKTLHAPSGKARS